MWAGVADLYEAVGVMWVGVADLYEASWLKASAADCVWGVRDGASFPLLPQLSLLLLLLLLACSLQDFVQMRS